MDKNGPATKKDLQDLETRLRGEMTAMETRIVDALTERIRDTQTELLRGFEKFQGANNIRLRKLEANQSNLDTSTSIRLENLEERVLEIEKKLILGRGQ